MDCKIFWESRDPFPFVQHLYSNTMKNALHIVGAEDLTWIESLYKTISRTVFLIKVSLI